MVNSITFETSELPQKENSDWELQRAERLLENLEDALESPCISGLSRIP